MYSPQLLDHFEHPRNSGELPDADADVRIENPACGDILELAIKMNAGRIGEIRFRAKGCVPAMACASAMTDLAKGKSRQEAMRSAERKSWLPLGACRRHRDMPRSWPRRPESRAAETRLNYPTPLPSPAPLPAAVCCTARCSSRGAQSAPRACRTPRSGRHGARRCDRHCAPSKLCAR